MNQLTHLILVALALWAAPSWAQTAASPSTALEQAVRAAPQSTKPRVALGKSYFHEGRFRDAARQWNVVLSRNGAHLKPVDRAKLARCIALALHHQGDQETARRYIERARADAPGDALVFKVAGLINAATLAQPTVEPTPAVSPPPPAPGYVRIQDLGNGLHGLQTARTTLVSNDGKVKIFLDGAVHMADPGYYKKLQTELAPCDAVLFEAVTQDPGDLQFMDKPSPNDPALKMAASLGLVAQRLSIDYRKPNFVWADMTMADLRQYQLSPGFQAVLKGDPATPTANIDDLKEVSVRDVLQAPSLGAAKEPARQRELRGQIAAVLQVGGGDAGAFGAPKAVQELLIYRRNDYVMRTLTDEIGKRKQATISIFYGAGHMSDLARRLDCMGYKITGTEWRTAWTY